MKLRTSSTRTLLSFSVLMTLWTACGDDTTTTGTSNGTSTDTSMGTSTETSTSTGTSTTLCQDNGVTVTIEENHPTGSHTLDIPIDDIEAAIEVTYDIQGNNTGHGHTVTVAAQDFMDLGSGIDVTLMSSDTGAAGMDHTHVVTLSCNG